MTLGSGDLAIATPVSTGRQSLYPIAGILADDTGQLCIPVELSTGRYSLLRVETISAALMSCVNSFTDAFGRTEDPLNGDYEQMYALGTTDWRCDGDEAVLDSTADGTSIATTVLYNAPFCSDDVLVEISDITHPEPGFPSGEAAQESVSFRIFARGSRNDMVFPAELSTGRYTLVGAIVNTTWLPRWGYVAHVRTLGGNPASDIYLQKRVNNVQTEIATTHYAHDITITSLMLCCEGGRIKARVETGSSGDLWLSVADGDVDGSHGDYCGWFGGLKFYSNETLNVGSFSMAAGVCGGSAWSGS